MDSLIHPTAWTLSGQNQTAMQTWAHHQLAQNAVLQVMLTRASQGHPARLPGLVLRQHPALYNARTKLWTVWYWHSCRATCVQRHICNLPGRRGQQGAEVPESQEPSSKACLISFPKVSRKRKKRNSHMCKSGSFRIYHCQCTAVFIKSGIDDIIAMHPSCRLSTASVGSRQPKDVHSALCREVCLQTRLRRVHSANSK